MAPLKLLEFGFSKETMASMAVIQTPFTVLGSLFAGRWVAKKSPIFVYLFGWCLRIAISFTGPICLAVLQKLNGVVTPAYYMSVLTLSLLYAISSECLMFVGMGAFFLNITASSVHVAGSYLTLLNTASNMGGMWHKAIVLWLVEVLTVREKCLLSANDIVQGKKCDIIYDGYYVISALLIPFTIAAGVHIFRTLPRLSKLPNSAWNAGR